MISKRSIVSSVGQIDSDAHIHDNTIHFQANNIDHANINNSGTFTHAQIDTFVNSKDAANGLCVLDSTSKVPIINMPFDAMQYCGSWTPNTSPILQSGIGTKGCYHVANADATITAVDGITNIFLGDWMVYNGTIW